MMNSVTLNQRSDAKANRERLLQVARAAFTADPEASLNSIAKAAGVGPGTLYRHFPSREQLIVAVNRAEVEQFVGFAEDLLTGHRPCDAFRLWCNRLIDHVAGQRGFRETLRATLSLAEQEATYRPMREAIDTLLRAGEAAGEFRPGIEATDVQLLLSFVWQVQTDEGMRRARHGIHILLRGLAR